MGSSRHRSLLALTFAGFIASQAAPSAAQERIGSASSTSNQVEGIVAGAVRTLAAGSEVYRNELVRTGDASLARLVFLDDTNLSMGPRSEVTLDRFVYNPGRGAGSVVVRAGRGVFRFVTGSQRPQNYVIETPIATIGVRGTVFDLVVEPDRIIVVLRSGRLRITTRQGRVVTLQPGDTLTVFADGSLSRRADWSGITPVDFAGLFGPTPAAPVQIAEPATRITPRALPSRSAAVSRMQPLPPAWSGSFVGAHVVGSWSGVGTSEFSRLTGVQTAHFDDSGNGFGGGIGGGYDWQPGNGNVVVGIVLDADFVNDRVAHVFTTGNFIASTVDFMASARMRIGALAAPTTLIYLQTGVSVAQQKLQINFGGPVTDERRFTTGFTAGFGGELMLPGVLAAGTSLFAEYERTWWDKAKLEAPVASPLFDYSWRRESDTIKAGFRVRFGSSALVGAAAGMPVKAPVLK